MDVISPNKKIYHCVVHLVCQYEKQPASFFFLFFPPHFLFLCFDKCAKSMITPSKALQTRSAQLYCLIKKTLWLQSPSKRNDTLFIVRPLSAGMGEYKSRWVKHFTFISDGQRTDESIITCLQLASFNTELDELVKYRWPPCGCVEPINLCRFYRVWFKCEGSVNWIFWQSLVTLPSEHDF